MPKPTPPGESGARETAAEAPAEGAGEGPLAGAVVREVRQPSPHEIQLHLFRPGSGEADWLLSIHPECPRLLRPFRRAKNAPRPPIFCQWLRARLVGARLGAPRLLAPQVLELPAETGEGVRLSLVLEANGAESNLLLLDAEARLLIALRHPALPGRRLAPGDRYRPPVQPRALPAGLPRTLWGEAGWRREVPEPEARARDAAAREQEAGASFEALQRAARQTARAEAKKLRRRIENQRADLERAEGAAQLRRWGELLKIHRERLRAGMAGVTLPDEFDPARPEVTIPLDPRAGPAENIERLFLRYRKLRAAIPHIRRRLAEAERALADWEAAAEAAEGAGERDALEAAFRRLGRPLPRGRGAAPPAPARQAEPPNHVLQRQSSDGYTILVGRSKEANDRVTFRLGNGRDWWFHAQGVPGSHVIVRNPSGGALPERTLREAAWLAAYYSQRRAEGQLDVDYTQRKHVRKIKGAEPGQVTYSQNRTLLVELANARDAAILGEGGEAEAGT